MRTNRRKNTTTVFGALIVSNVYPGYFSVRFHITSDLGVGIGGMATHSHTPTPTNQPFEYEGEHLDRTSRENDRKPQKKKKKWRRKSWITSIDHMRPRFSPVHNSLVLLIVYWSGRNEIEGLSEINWLPIWARYCFSQFPENELCVKERGHCVRCAVLAYCTVRLHFTFISKERKQFIIKSGGTEVISAVIVIDIAVFAFCKYSFSPFVFKLFCLPENKRLVGFAARAPTSGALARGDLFHNCFEWFFKLSKRSKMDGF